MIPFKWDSTLNFGNGGKASNSIYFFDANSPDTLSESLGYAIQSAISASNINTVTNPNLPYVGASLGNQIYVGRFRPPTNGGSIWGGDMLMFNTILSSNTLKFLDTSGNTTTTLDTTTAQWSAQQAMYYNRLWKNRKLYTAHPAQLLLHGRGQPDGEFRRHEHNPAELRPPRGSMWPPTRRAAPPRRTSCAS